MVCWLYELPVTTMRFLVTGTVMSFRWYLLNINSGTFIGIADFCSIIAKTPPLGCPDEKEAAIRPTENTGVNALLGIKEIAIIFVSR